MLCCASDARSSSTGTWFLVSITLGGLSPPVSSSAGGAFASSWGSFGSSWGAFASSSGAFSLALGASSSAGGASGGGFAVAGGFALLFDASKLLSVLYFLLKTGLDTQIIIIKATKLC